MVNLPVHCIKSLYNFLCYKILKKKKTIYRNHSTYIFFYEANFKKLIILDTTWEKIKKLHKHGVGNNWNLRELWINKYV